MYVALRADIHTKKPPGECRTAQEELVSLSRYVGTVDYRFHSMPKPNPAAVVLSS